MAGEKAAIDRSAEPSDQERPTAVRSLGIPDSAGPPLAPSDGREQVEAWLKAHPGHASAKSGDVAAAARLVRDIVPKAVLLEARSRFAGALFVPVIAQEASGENRLPHAYARLLAAIAGGDVEIRIVQSTRAFHTGASAMERLVSRPLFDGPIEPGRNYVIVDDVTVMGATLAELASHIQAGGGVVIGTALLVNASRTGLMTPPPDRIRLAERRFGDVLKDELGIEPRALTAPEAGYVAGFRDSDALRAAIAKARRSRSGRLASKGV